MIKYLLIVINSFFLFVYGIFNGDNGISITSNFPANMVAGKETSIEITVSKGAMNGFAKLQLEIPSDFTVKEAEEKGATYTFNEGIAKWVWAALPSENEIIIKLVIVPSESSRGPKTITAKYSYVENNVKQVVEMTPADITVVGEGEVASVAPEETPSSPATQAETPAEPTKPDTSAGLPAQVTSNIENPGSISIERTATALTPDKYEIKLLIAKGTTKGFARYSDDLPANVTVRSSSTDGASFSVADGKIKFVWASVPEKDTLYISYTIVSTRTQAVELKGEYSYLEDNQSKKKKADVSSILFEVPVAAKTEKKPEPEKKPENEAKPEQQQVAAATEKPAKQNAKKEKPVKTKVKSPELAAATSNGMLYHVQIGAFSKIKAGATRLEKKFKVEEEIISDMQGGFSKYMVGNHPEYKEARDHRETVINSNGIKSAFVVAYNQGKRITVQEALMISNQKWFK